jgi:hypothetical protein
MYIEGCPLAVWKHTLEGGSLGKSIYIQVYNVCSYLCPMGSIRRGILPGVPECLSKCLSLRPYWLPPPLLLQASVSSPVLRIHDILVWIRIRIRGSMPLTNGSGSGSFFFHHWPSRCQQKTNFFKKFFSTVLLKVLLHHFSKIKSQKEVTKL